MEMSTPTCHREGCNRPVKRRYGRERTSKLLGMRIVDGVQWRWFCSKSCTSRSDDIAPFRRVNILPATKANKANRERRAIQRLVEACKPHMDERGRVDPRDLVKVMIVELRRERNNMASLYYHQGSAVA